MAKSSAVSVSTIVPIFDLAETNQDTTGGDGSPSSTNALFSFTSKEGRKKKQPLCKNGSCQKTETNHDFRLQLILLICIIALLVIWAALYFPLTKNFQ